MSIVTRSAVVAAAQTWRGTKFHDNARIKGGGVDCGQLIIAVYREAGAHVEEYGDYSPQWHLHNRDERFLAHVLMHSQEIAEADLLPADMILWKFGRCYSHGAIYIGNRQIVHAVKVDRCVRMARMDEGALGWRPRRFFRWMGFSPPTTEFWGKDV